MLQRAASSAPSPLAYAASEAHLTEGNVVTLLAGGAEAFPAMLEAIWGATREVFLESYIVAPDQTGRAFVDSLLGAARRGVKVHFILDGVGSLALPQAWLDDLERAGGQVVVYRPVAPWRRRWGLWRRDHRKILVVDNSVGFVGGVNLADEYDTRTLDGEVASWRDLHMRVAGPAASALAELFLATWNREATPERILRSWRPSSAPFPDGVPVAVVGNRERRHRALIRRSLLFALRHAERRVTVANPYFVPDAPVARELRRAARRGVDVRIVVPEQSDILLVDLAARATFPRLAKAGARIAEWPGMMHAKAIAIDGAWATVGSYNLDHRSLRFNLEVTANVFDRTFAGAVEAQLVDYFARSREVTREDLKYRSIIARVLSSLAYRLRSIL